MQIIYMQHMSLVFYPRFNPDTDNSQENKTWWGCGNHVPMYVVIIFLHCINTQDKLMGVNDRVMDKVDSKDWCTCEPKVEKEGKEYPPKGTTPD